MPSSPTAAAPVQSPTPLPVHRVEVRLRDASTDPRAVSVGKQAALAGLSPTRVGVTRVYLIEADLSPAELDAVRAKLLADPVSESASATAPVGGSTGSLVEVHPLPGVMDPAAQSVRDAIVDLTGKAVEVSTGMRYDLAGVGAAEAEAFARRSLCNPVIHAVHMKPYHPAGLPKGHEQPLSVRQIAIRDLNDEQLTKMSREAHLFLSLDEMKAVQTEYRTLGREPRDIELETIAQTWSEHCVHKTLKSTIRYRGGEDDVISWAGRPGHTVHADGSVTIKNLLKSTVAAATFELIAEGCDWALSVFKDNSGVIAFDDQWGVNIKVETHNRPSAIEPYGGAATGIGGCIRDVIGTGLGAKPIASTDVFCVADGSRFGMVKIGDVSALSLASEGVITRVFADPPTNHESNEAHHATLGSMLDVFHALGDKSTVFRMRTGEPGPEGTVEYLVWRGTREERGNKTFETDPLPASVWLPYATSLTNVHVLRQLPPGVLPPRRVLTDVVAGIRDYGNRMGIPTVSGGVYFDDRHIGNPLVFAGCVGLIPRHLIKGEARPGDRIIALGGRTGRDGVHGATFSSAELGSNASTEFAHAVQIGNAIEEKRVLDAILRARDAGPLYHGMTDCGAGGFSSAVGEMGGTIGAEVHLDRAPLKYAGLTYTEIWISEAQERMVLAVPEKNIAALAKICDEEGVPMADLGHFGTAGAELVLHYKGTEVGRLPMSFLHDGIPMPAREAVHEPDAPARGKGTPLGSNPTLARGARSVGTSLLSLLAHPNIASKHWIIRQYDHEVQGNVVAKPLVGPAGRGPGDAAVLEPVPGSGRGIALSQGLQTPVGDPLLGGDAYLMVLAAVDEVVRNLVCVGTDPTRIAILDNFCWPSCGEPRNLATLVRAAEGCYDAAKAYRTPFVSGKDSLNNQLRYTDPASGEAKVIEIPPTLLVTGIGIVPSVARTVTMDAKAAGNVLVMVGARTTDELGASHYAAVTGATNSTIPRVDLKLGPAAAAAVAQMIRDGLVASAHDCSEGGVLAAVAEMLIASGSMPAAGTSNTLNDLLRSSRTASAGPAPLGLRVTADIGTLEQHEWAFAENASRYVLEVREADLPKVRTILADFGRSCGGLWHTVLGRLDTSGVLAWDQADLSVPVEDLFRAWHGPLDW